METVGQPLSVPDPHWPLDVLLLILNLLAHNGEAAPFQRLAFLTHRDGSLACAARKIPRPLLLTVGGSSEDGFEFLIPFEQAAVVKIEIDWGDGSERQTLEDEEAQFAKHRYASTGQYQVRIFPHGAAKHLPRSKGARKRLWLDHLGWTITKRFHALESKRMSWWKPIRSIKSWGSLGLRSLAGLFSFAADFNAPLPDYLPDTVHDISNMFFEASTFNHPSVSGWNVKNVANMSRLFRSAFKFNQDLSQWDVGNVTDTSGMFRDASAFDKDISSWNVGKVTTMASMFCSATQFNQPIGAWNVAGVTNMASMFQYAWEFNQPIGEWNVANVKDMHDMFYGAKRFDQDIEGWNVAKVRT